MRVNPYNWSKQSRDHLAFAQQNYPTIAALVSHANGYPAYALGAQALSPAKKQRYMNEWRNWYDQFGRPWERLGGIRERYFGQVTARHRVVPYRGRLGALGSFDTSVGRPPPPSGQTIRPYPSKTFTWVGPTISVPGYPGWSSRPANVPGYKGVSYIYWRHDPYDLYMTAGAVDKTKTTSPVTYPENPPDLPTSSMETPLAGAGISPWILVVAGGALIGGVMYAARKRKRRK